MKPVRPPNNATIRRPRREAPEAAPTPEVAPVAEVVPAPEVVAAPPPMERRRLHAPAPEVAPVAAASNLPVRGPTDFAGLREIAEMSAADVRAALEDYTRKAPTSRLRRGQRVTGPITRLTNSTAFIDVGAKADGVLERIEVSSTAQVGDIIEAFVTSSPFEGEIKLTRTPSGDAATDMLEEAKTHRTVIDGKVTASSEHGLQIELNGGLRAFCPQSQAGLHPVGDMADYVGRTLGFRVLELKGREAIVSHRSVAEDLAVAERRQAFETVREGDVYEGTVIRLKEFGAFVRIQGNVEGLVRLGDISSKGRIQHPNEVLKEGQEVKVRVLAVDAASQRLTLGIRQAEREVSAISDTRGANLAPAKTESFGLMAGLLSSWKPTPKPAKADNVKTVKRR